MRLKYTHYQLVSGVRFKINYYGVLLRCLEKQDVDKVLKVIHDRPTEGHFYGEKTTHKILREIYYYPMVVKYVHAYAWSRDICQKYTRREKSFFVPLQPIVVEETFKE